MISENLFQGLKLLSELDAEMILGRGELEEADEIRGRLELLCNSLSLAESNAFNRITCEKVRPEDIRKRLGLDEDCTA